MHPGVVQHGEFHSAEQAGGETVSMAIPTALSHRSARRVSLRILQRLKTKNIRITVKLLEMCTRRRARPNNMHVYKKFFWKKLKIQ